MKTELSNDIGQELAASVIAVPPLCRDSAGGVDVDNNRKLIQHIEAGGVTTLLYGGNANFYHVSLSEYGGLLETLAGLAGDDTWVIPSAGPAFGVFTRAGGRFEGL